MGESLVQQLSFSLAARDQLRNLVSLRNLGQLRSLQGLLRQWICLQSSDMWQDALEQKILLQHLKTFAEELRTLEEQAQSEEFAVRALKKLAVSELLRKKHLACEQASLPWPS